jgi:hypothetical protein
MGRQITISAITGTEQYHVYVCNTDVTTCVYMATFNDVDVPYTVTIPPPYDTSDSYSIKIVDYNNCEIIKIY